MKISTCCGCETDFTEIGICPECLEHCDFEEDEEQELEADRQTENQIEEEKINKHQNK
jgi:hypothetical protein